jgi:pyruvate/2-oxoacid:ferredoxin oxidoreductase beta subunit
MTLDNKFDEYYEKNFYQGGTTCCPGCGGPLLWRMILEALGPNTIVYGDGPCAM